MIANARPLVAGAIAATIWFVAQGGFANPAGEIIVHGDITFDRSVPGQLSILQGGDRGIIHWNDFSISAGEHTRFNQPGANAATLNRVISSLSSRIDGKLSANGKIFLINPNGIIVGPSGRIDAASFVASTLDVPDDAFLAGGDLRFSGSSRAAVVNYGTINAIGGDVFLLGAHVENHGQISAPSGTVGLGAGQDILLRQAGSDERLFIKPAGENLGGTGITNTGTIEAARAELKAHGNVYALAINNSGMIRATGAARKNGRVLLGAPGGKILHSGTITALNADGSGGEVRIDATPGGEIVATGRIEASGRPGSGTPGGDVVLAAARIELGGIASVDVSGDTRGGIIRIGGGPQGRDSSIENASEVIVGPGVHLSADARRSGNGGTVIVWSDGSTTFEGSISAQALGSSGHGGFAEVSGLRSLNFSGISDLRSASGETGTLLLDPTDADINAAVAAAIAGNLAFSNVVFSTNAAGGQPGNITVSAAINSNSPNTLGIFAHGDVQVNGNINLPNGTLGLIAGWDGATENPGASGVQPVAGVNLDNFFFNPATYGNNNRTVVINQPVSANVIALAGDGITQNGNLAGGSAVALAHRQPYNQVAGQLNSPLLQLFDTGDFGAMTNVNQVQFIKTGGNINAVNQNAVNFNGNFNSPGGFLFQTLAGNVTFDPGFNLVSSGVPPVTIVAGQNLINNAGAGVFGGSNFAIYTQGPGGDLDGGLLGFAAQQFNSPFPTPALNPQSFLYPGPAVPPVVPGPGPGPFIGPLGPPAIVDIEIDPATFVFPIFPENFFDPTFAGNTGRNVPILPALDFGGEDIGGFEWGEVTPRIGLTYSTGEQTIESFQLTLDFYDKLFGDDPQEIVVTPARDDNWAPFSSRGPRFGNNFILKPNVVAPGVTVRSFPSGDENGFADGTGLVLGGLPDTRSELQREMDIRRKLRAGDEDGIKEAVDHIKDKYPDAGPEPGEQTIDWLEGFDEFAGALNDFFIIKEADIKKRLREGDPTAPGDAFRHLRLKYGGYEGPAGDRPTTHDRVERSNEFGDSLAEWKRKEFQRIVDLLEAGDPEGIGEAVKYLRFIRTATRSGPLGAATTREKLLNSPFADALRAFEAKQEADIKERLANGDVTAAADAIALTRWQRSGAARSGFTPPKSDYDTLAGSERFGDLIKALDRDEVEAALAEARRQSEIAYLRNQIATGRTIFAGSTFLYDEETRAAYEKAFSALEEHLRHLEDPDNNPRPPNPLTQAEIDRVDGILGFQVTHYLGEPAAVLPSDFLPLPDFSKLERDLAQLARVLDPLPPNQQLDPDSEEARQFRDFIKRTNEAIRVIAEQTKDPKVPPAAQPGADFLEGKLEDFFGGFPIFPLPEKPTPEEVEQWVRSIVERSFLGGAPVPLPTVDPDDPPEPPDEETRKAMDEFVRELREALGEDDGPKLPDGLVFPEVPIESIFEKLITSGIVILPTPDPVDPADPVEQRRIRDFLEQAAEAARVIGEETGQADSDPLVSAEELREIQETIRRFDRFFDELTEDSIVQGEALERALADAAEDAARVLQDDPPPSAADARRGAAAIDTLNRFFINGNIFVLPTAPEDPGDVETQKQFENFQRLVDEAVRSLDEVFRDAAWDAAQSESPDDPPAAGRIVEFKGYFEDSFTYLILNGHVPLPTPETWIPTPAESGAIAKAAGELLKAIESAGTADPVGAAAQETEKDKAIDEATARAFNSLAGSGLFPPTTILPPSFGESDPELERIIEEALTRTDGGDSWRGTVQEASETVDVTGVIVRAIRESLLGGEPPILDPDEIKRRLTEGDRNAIDELVRWWHANPEVVAINGWPQGFQDARQAYIDWWKKNLDERFRKGDKTAYDDFARLVEEFTFGILDLDDTPGEIEIFREWGLEDARQAFIDFWRADIDRRLRNGDWTAIDDLIWLDKMYFQFGTIDVSKPGPSIFENHGLKEARQAFIDWWVADINKRLEEGDLTAIDDLIRLADLIDNSGTTRAGDPNTPGNQFIRDKFGDALKTFREKWIAEIRRRLRAGDKTAIDDFLLLADVFDNSGSTQAGEKIDWWAKYGLKEDYDAFIQWWIDDITRRLENGDRTAIEDMLWLAELLDPGGVRNTLDPDPGQKWIDKTFGEALKTFREKWREKIRRGLREGDPDAFKEMLEYVEFYSKGGVINTASGDPGENIINSEFGDALKLYYLMVESRIRAGLREGDPEAVKKAVEHLVLKGIDVGTTPEEQRQAILDSREFGDPAGQFERQTGTTLDEFVGDLSKPAPAPTSDLDPPTFR